MSQKTIRPSAACRAASAASVDCATSVAAFSGKLYQPVPGARPPGLPKISSSPRLISGAVFSVGIPPTAFAITNYFGQFDCNVCIALLMSSSGITPRSARLLSLMDTASSGTACQVFSTRADAFSGSSTKVPGGTTLAMNSVVTARATTITLGCAAA